MSEITLPIFEKIVGGTVKLNDWVKLSFKLDRHSKIAEPELLVGKESPVRISLSEVELRALYIDVLEFYDKEWDKHLRVTAKSEGSDADDETDGGEGVGVKSEPRPKKAVSPLKPKPRKASKALVPAEKGSKSGSSAKLNKRQEELVAALEGVGLEWMESDLERMGICSTIALRRHTIAQIQETLARPKPLGKRSRTSSGACSFATTS